MTTKHTAASVSRTNPATVAAKLNAQVQTLHAIADRIKDFDKYCKRWDHTDTGEVWEMLYEIQRMCKAQP